MAKVGEQLLQPEAGWKRYDDTDNNISYEGNWIKSSNLDWYNSTIAYNFNNQFSGNLLLRFNFTKTKLRIIGQNYAQYSSNIKIKIDGKEIGCFTQNASQASNQVLNYEKLDLSNSQHYVEIYTLNNEGFSLDAIDIDENGELKPYNPNLYKALIKQDTNYIAIKSEFYKELGQPSSDTELDEWFEKYGTHDLSVLTQDITIGVETFKPKDKLKENNNGKFDVLMKKIG